MQLKWIPKTAFWNVEDCRFTWNRIGKDRLLTISPSSMEYRMPCASSAAGRIHARKWKKFLTIFG
jgi:hypothetical protein